MGRHEKIGLDYFPMDTVWEQNMKLVKARFKLVGVGCILEIWKTIYSEGYALKWDEDARLLFASENGIEPEDLDKIVNYAVKKGLFDARLLVEKSVLTSHGIQKRWLEISRLSKRKNCSIASELNLLTINSGNPPEETHYIPEDTPFPPEFIQQSKVKESKVKKEFAAPVETPGSDTPVENFDQAPDSPSMPTFELDPAQGLTIPDGVTFSPVELQALLDAVGPDAQAHLDKFARKLSMHRYGYKNHWAAMRDFWSNAGGPKAWLSPRDSPPTGNPVPGEVQTKAAIARQLRYQAESATLEEVRNFEHKMASVLVGRNRF